MGRFRKRSLLRRGRKRVAVGSRHGIWGHQGRPPATNLKVQVHGMENGESYPLPGSFSDREIRPPADGTRRREHEFLRNGCRGVLGSGSTPWLLISLGLGLVVLGMWCGRSSFPGTSRPATVSAPSHPPRISPRTIFAQRPRRRPGVIPSAPTPPSTTSGDRKWKGHPTRRKVP